MTYDCYCGEKFIVVSKNDCQDFLRVIWHIEQHNRDLRNQYGNFLKKLVEQLGLDEDV